ncbi:uncharacterized protein NPIL_346411 [Nephila pilipes]|uniref:Uncharacterized protein n=1 Tax=Nephila pilipes TaxID=299642 RepID=A0A8X6MZK1_NEPPI|nr:uncharacterized protein NPIL_346411 [Nephila pilipes]
MKEPSSHLQEKRQCVAAWTLTSESVHTRSQPNTLHHGGSLSYRTSDHVFEERNDDIEFGQKLPIGAAVNKDVIGPSLEEERDILPPSPEEQPARDPLYVVHYVPQGKEAGSEPPKPPKETGSDVLQKILSAGGKGTGKGTPQFVVFAPSPEEEDVDDDDEISARVTRKRVKKKKKARRDPVEYDDEYPEHSQIKQQVTSVGSRPRNTEYESGEYHHQQQYNNHQTHQHNHQPQQHMPCCQQPPMMTTAAPGLTIQMGHGMSPLGMLRQILRPKVDLRKKLFFGIQLENGMGFGGEQPAAGGGGMMPAGGGMMPGHGGMGQQPGHQQQGGGMYRFG